MLMRHITQGGCGRPGAAREKTHSRPTGRCPRQLRADSARSRAPPGLGRATSYSSPRHRLSRLTSHEPAEALDRAGAGPPPAQRPVCHETPHSAIFALSQLRQPGGGRCHKPASAAAAGYWLDNDLRRRALLQLQLGWNIRQSIALAPFFSFSLCWIGSQG